jgi:hypothetical protein
MFFTWQLAAIALALLLVEFASFWHLTSWLTWGYPDVLAITTGLAYIGLLVGGIVALIQDIPASLRGRIRLAGVLLFVTQGISNVLIAFEHAVAFMPVAIPMRFFGIDQDTALHATAILQGSVLSLTSIWFWQVLGDMLRCRLDERKTRPRLLRDLAELLEEETPNVPSV